MTLTPGDILIDFSYAHPDPAKIAQAGAKGVLRYSAGAASDPGNPSHAANAGKLISPPEFKALLAAGLDVVANDEWYTSRITEGGSAGQQDGAAARRLWQECGYAKGATIYVSWDEYPSPSKFLSVLRYRSGYSKGLAGYYQFDSYGGTGFLKWAFKHALVRFGWRPNAGSWSGDGLPYQPDTSTPAKRAALVQLALGKTPAHIWQTGNYWFNKSADENLVVRIPVGSHLETLAAANPPVPKPPVIPDPINSQELALTPEDKAYLDAKFAEANQALRGALSDSKGKPHALRTWLSKLAGKNVDLAK